MSQHVKDANAFCQFTKKLLEPLSQPSSKSEFFVMNFGCGECHEAVPFAQTTQSSLNAKSVHTLGLDLRPEVLMKAQERISQELPYNSQGLAFDFLRSAVNDKKELPTLPNKIDLAVFRHQNTWFDPVAWTRMFEFALTNLSKDGSIVISSYFKQEHLLALKIFEKLGANIVTNQNNPASREISSGKWVDGFGAVIKSHNR